MPQWNSPELIILGRANTEEAVLSACKGTGIVGPHAPNDCQGNSLNPQGIVIACCSTMGSS